MFEYELSRIGNTIEEANKLIIEERLMYKELYEIIEKYVKEHNIIIGGQLGIDLLIDIPQHKDSFDYVLYVNNALKYANELINILHDSGQHFKNKEITKYICLDTVTPYKEFAIRLEDRMLATFINLDKYKGIDMQTLITPLHADTYFNKGKQMLLLPPEHQLIDIYQKLYSPLNVGEWEDLIEDELSLNKLLKERIDLKVIGGKDTSFKEKTAIESAIFEKFIYDNDNIVLIGNRAINLENTGKVQIISENNIEYDFSCIEKIIQSVTKKYPITVREQTLKITNDTRILRNTIYITNDTNKKNKAIIDIFNSAHYELIPYNINKIFSGSKKQHIIKTANPYVIMRFLLIDYWTIRIIQQLNIMPERTAQILMKIIYDDIENLRSKLQSDTEFILSDNLRGVFQYDRYIGSYENEDIAKKLAKLKLKKVFYKYYPGLELKNKKEYRKMY